MSPADVYTGYFFIIGVIMEYTDKCVHDFEDVCLLFDPDVDQELGCDSEGECLQQNGCCMYNPKIIEERISQISSE